MKWDVLVAIVEDDPFSRNWMALLAARDRRTRVVAEVGDLSSLLPHLAGDTCRIDVLLIDSDIPGREDLISGWTLGGPARAGRPKILLTGINADPRALHQMKPDFYAGYILKGEISTSLAWAITLAAAGYWVITPGIQTLAYTARFRLPLPCMVLDGCQPFYNLTDYQTRVARLAFLFSMERHELANELGISQEWSYGLVSAIYERLGLKTFLAGDSASLHDLDVSEEIAAYLEAVRAKLNNSGRPKDLESLAFHLLTIPLVKKFDRDSSW